MEFTIVIDRILSIINHAKDAEYVFKVYLPLHFCRRNGRVVERGGLENR